MESSTITPPASISTSITQLYNNNCNSKSRKIPNYTSFPPRLLTRMSSFVLLITIIVVINTSSFQPVNGQMYQEHEYESNHHSSDDTENEYGVKYANCTRCSLQSESRARRLLEIKADILNKLGLKSAPNITINPRELQLPPLQNLLRSNRDNFGHNTVDHRGSGGHDSGMDINMMMAGDQPIPDDDSEDFEDFYVSAEKSLSIARNRKYLRNTSFKIQV